MLGPQTDLINGQRFNLPTGAQYNPMRYGPQTTGVPQVSPSMPPFMGASNGQGASLGVQQGVDGYGTADNNLLATQVANDHPHHMKVSPTWWVVIFLVGGLLLLRGVHWRSLEAGASGRVGPAAAEAHADA